MGKATVEPEEKVGMTEVEKKIFMAELRASARRAASRGEIRPELFRFDFNSSSKRWRVIGLQVDAWHWLESCTDVFPEGTVRRYWIGKFMLKVRIWPL